MVFGLGELIRTENRLGKKLAFSAGAGGLRTSDNISGAATVVIVVTIDAHDDAGIIAVALGAGGGINGRLVSPDRREREECS